MSRKDLVRTAAEEDGIKETPPGSNKTKYGQWYGLNGEKCCAIFVSWVYDRAGYPLGRIETNKGFQSCQGGYNFWKLHGQLTNKPQAGDISLFDWTGDGHCDHTGIFDSWVDENETWFYSWEGNTATNNDSDGGMVMRRKRNRALVKAFASPGVLENPSPASETNYLKKGAIGADVTAMQMILHELEYPITVDGIFGEQTEALVKQYQNKYHMEVTGMVTPSLLGAMKEEAERPPVSLRKFTSGSYLRKGNAGAAVVALQAALNDAGANPKINADGVFGNETVKALKSFQERSQLTIDGVAGPETFARLGLSV